MSVQTDLAAVSVYQMSVESFIRSLTALGLILEKAKKFSETKKVDMAVLFQTRLVPDQFPLAKQIQIACDTAKLFVTRLSGIQGPVFDDSEKTYEDFQSRIQQTLTFLKSVPANSLNEFRDKTISFPWNPGKTLDGESYVVEYAVPNFYFHVTTAYSILRSNGMELGKSDYLGGVNWKQTA